MIRGTSGIQAMLLGLLALWLTCVSLEGHAQFCTVQNWSDWQGLADADTGLPGADHRRYSGPCSLRVPVDGTARFLLDQSPGAEQSYKARFYVFLDHAGPAAFPIFSAGQGSENLIEVWHNQPEENNLEFRFLDSTSAYQTLVFNDVGPGWHSVEVVWEAGSSVTVVGSLDGNDQTATIDVGNRQIDWARLGIPEPFQLTEAGHVDFDAFESRSETRPGRLMRGDANADNQIDIFDAQAIYDESAGTGHAYGQPDCNEDGAINVLDALCVFELMSATEPNAAPGYHPAAMQTFDMIFADRFEGY